MTAHSFLGVLRSRWYYLAGGGVVLALTFLSVVMIPLTLLPGLGALVLGGAAVAASKLGFFAKFAAFFGKLFAALGKFIVLIIAAIGAFFAKLWKKITGRA